ncbi:MAG: ATP-binding protein [Pseudomonadota bacterium]
MDKEKHPFPAEKSEKTGAEKKVLKSQLAALKREKIGLQKSLEMKKSLLDSLPSGVVLLREGRIIHANVSILDQMGYSVEEVIDRHFLDFVHSRSTEMARAIHERGVSGKWVPDPFEIEIVTKEGNRLCYEVGIKKIKSSGRNAFLVNLTGIDNRKAREREIMQSKKNEALATMASGMKLELDPHLKTINEKTSDLKALINSENPEIMAGLEAIQSAAGLIGSAIWKLELISQKEYDRLDKIPFDLKKVVKRAIAMTAPKWKDGGIARGGKINLKTYLRSVHPAEGNPEEIEEVISHMILNAVDALPEGGDIYLTTEEKGGQAHIYIQDNGVGIPGKIGDRVYDPFFTTKSDNSKGLGLTLSRAIVERHGGEMEVSGEKGQGTTVLLRLPLSRPEENPKAPPVRKNKKDAGILIIDDEGRILDLLSQLLAAKGFRTVTATSLSEAVTILKRKPFHLVISGALAPGIDEKALIKTFKRMNRELLVALIEDQGSDKKIRKTVKYKADLLIQRPVEINRVVDQISDLLKRKA